MLPVFSIATIVVTITLHALAEEDSGGWGGGALDIC